MLHGQYTTPPGIAQQFFFFEKFGRIALFELQFIDVRFTFLHQLNRLNIDRGETAAESLTMAASLRFLAAPGALEALMRDWGPSPSLHRLRPPPGRDRERHWEPVEESSGGAAGRWRRTQLYACFMHNSRGSVFPAQKTRANLHRHPTNCWGGACRLRKTSGHCDPPWSGQLSGTNFRHSQ
jgi:hypothetical protein